MIKNKRGSYALIGVLPVLSVITYLIVGNGKGPYYWTPNQDPDYAYLTNGLLAAMFQSPRHTDHPGTPLQVLVAIMIWIGHFFRSLFDPALSKNFVTDVLTHPESYLHLINFALLLIMAIASFLLGWVAYRFSHSLIQVMILQISPFLMIKTHLADEPSRVSPDVLVFCISHILAIVLIYYLYSKQVERSRNFALSLGAVFGIGMATKVTFIPMFVYFLLPKGWNRKGLALGAAIVTFFIATLPIISRYQRTFNWMTGLATHTGPYGGGEAGLVDKNTVGRNAYLLVTWNPVFFSILGTATLVCIVLAVLWKLGKLTGSAQQTDIQSSLRSDIRPGIRPGIRSGIRPDLYRVYFVLVLTVLAMWGQVALTVRAQPQGRYLDPSSGLIGLLIFLLVQISLEIIPTLIPRIRGDIRTNTIIPVIALAVCVMVSVQQLDSSIEKTTSQAKRRSADLAKIEAILQQDEYKTCTRVFSRRASQPESALKFADFWTGKQVGKYLQPLYPNALFFIDDDKDFETFTEKLDLATLSQRGNGCVLLEINALRNNRKAKHSPQENIEKIFEGRHEALYRIKT